MKHLPPTLREDYRYLEFRIESDSDFEIGEVTNAVWGAVLNYMGAKGASDLDFWVIANKFDEEEQRGVIRVKRDRVEDLRAALALINSVEKAPAFIYVVKSSGSLKIIR